jgi:hypothetical protein
MAAAPVLLTNARCQDTSNQYVPHFAYAFFTSFSI